MLVLRLHGVVAQVAPLLAKLCIVGVPLIVPAAHAPVPQVNGEERIDVVEPPDRIGLTEGVPASA